MSQVYINLPVLDLAKSIAFYQAIGFIQNMQFSDQNAAAMNRDENLTVMLLTHDFCKQFLPKDRQIADSHQTCEVLNALQLDSREVVDDFFAKAISAGATKTIDTYDHGFMYGCDFADLDGHIWEIFVMDVTQMPAE